MNPFRSPAGPSRPVTDSDGAATGATLRVATPIPEEYVLPQAGRATASWEAPSQIREVRAMCPTVGRVATKGAKRRGRAALAVALATTTLWVAACSSDDAASSKSKDSTTTTAATGSTEITTTTSVTGTSEATPGPTTVPETGATVPPVAMDQTSEFGNGVSARISKVTAMQAEASLPGETSGPAVSVTVEVTNGSDAAIDLGNVTVDLANAEGASAAPVTSQPDTSFSGPLAPGDSAQGTYVFRVAPDERANVVIKVKYSSDTPIAVFAGSVPNA